MSKGRTVENDIKWRDPFRKLFQVELWDQIRVIPVTICPETSVPFRLCSKHNSAGSIQWYAQISYKPKDDFWIDRWQQRKSEQIIGLSSSRCTGNRSLDEPPLKLLESGFNGQIPIFWDHDLTYGKSDYTIRQSSSSSTWNNDMSFETVF